MRTAAVAEGASGGGWFFANPSQEAKRERLRHEAEADLKAFLAKSGRKGSATPTRADTSYAAANAPYATTGPGATPGSTGRQAARQQVASSNPLLGVGERELRANPLLSRAAPPDDRPADSDHDDHKQHDRHTRQDEPRRRPVWLRDDAPHTPPRKQQPQQQQPQQRYRYNNDDYNDGYDDANADDDYFRSRLQPSRRDAPRRRRVPDYDYDDRYDELVDKPRYRDDEYSQTRFDESKGRRNDEMPPKRQRDYPEKKPARTNDDAGFFGGNGSGDGRRRSANARPVDPLSYEQQMAMKKEREREEKMRERQEIQHVMEQQRPAYAPQGSKPPPGGFSSLSLGGGGNVSSVPARQQPQHQQQNAVSNNSNKSSYLLELEEQIRLKKEREAQEKAKIKAEDLKKEQEMMNYNPFGKAGAGAPLRDAQGHIITHPRQSIAQQGTMTTNPQQMQNGYQQPVQQQQFQVQQPFMSQPTQQPFGMFQQQPFQPGWPSGYTSQFPPLSPNNLLSPFQNMALGGIGPAQSGFGQNYLGFQGGMGQQQMMAPPGAMNMMGQPNPTVSPISNQVKSEATKFLRGVQDINSLPDWQRAEVMRKHQLQAEHEDELKRQIAEKQRIKDLEAQKRREEEQRDFDRIEREKRELQELYSKNQDNRAIKAGGPENGGGNVALAPKQEAKPMDKAAMKEKADEELREKFLQAQREAEELKKNKFKAKREAAGPTKPNPEPSVQTSNDSVAPQTQTFRSSSPPLPTHQKGNKTNFDIDNLDESSVPVVPNPVPPKPNRPKVLTQKVAEEQQNRPLDNAQTDNTHPLSKTPAPQGVTNEAIQPAEAFQNKPGAVQQVRSPIRARKPPQPRVRQQSPIASPPVDTENVQLKTKAVLDQLSELKKSLELDQVQVMNDLRERSAPIKKFPVSDHAPIHHNSDTYVSSSYSEPAKIQAPFIPTPQFETVERARPVLTNEPTFSQPAPPPAPSFGNSGPSGHALLDKIISNVQSEMAPESAKSRPPIYGEIEESFLKRQEDMISRQQDEISRMRHQLNHSDQPTKSNGQLESTSSRIPVTNSFDVNLMQTASTQQPKPSFLKPQFQVNELKTAGRRRGSATSTIDLDAMDALNEARLKRLAALENEPQLNVTNDVNGSSGVLLDFLNRKNGHGSRPVSGKSLFSESVLKRTNE